MIIFKRLTVHLFFKVYICKAQNSDEDDNSSTAKPGEFKLKPNETLHLFLLAVKNI